MLSNRLKQTLAVFLVLTLISVGLGYEAMQLLQNPQYAACDLEARWFGILVGLYYGIVSAAGFAVVSRVFNLWHSETTLDRQGYETMESPIADPPEFSLIRGTGKLLVYVLLFSFGAALWGIWQGANIDYDYFQAFGPAAQRSETDAPDLVLPLLLVLYGLALTGLSAGAVVIVAVGVSIVVHKTDLLARPNLKLEPKELQEGIYLYANDVCFNLPINLYSSRLGGFTHTGLCFITKDPDRANRVRKLNNLHELKFTKLIRGYSFCDLNVDLTDRDGLSNHGASAALSNDSFPFDVAGLKNYLAGRSANDRLTPSVQLLQLSIINPLAEWDKAIAFEEKFNQMFPDGILYSPIPYEGRFAPLYNCNTLTAGIAAVLLEQDARCDRLTDIPYTFGGQTSEQGRQALKEVTSPDFPEKLAKQREFMKTAPRNQQAIWHRLLHRDGWIYEKIGTMDDKRY